LEVLVVEILEGNGTDGSIGIFPLKCGVSDERRHVLFQLGQVRNNIVFSKDNTVLVILFLSYTKEELALLEHFHHDTNMSLDLLKHVFGAVSLILSFSNLLIEHIYFISK